MLNALKHIALNKGYQKARKKGIYCPDCGKKMVLPSHFPQGGFDAMFSCQSCSWRGVANELMFLDDVGKERRTGEFSIVEKPSADAVSDYDVEDRVEVHKKRLVIEEVSEDQFRIVLKGGLSPLFLIGSVIFIMVGVFLVYEGVSGFLSETSTGWFRLFSSVFNIVPLLMGVFFLIVSLSAFTVQVVHWFSVKRLFFDGERVIVDDGLGDEYTRDSFSELRVSNSGYLDNHSRYKFILIGERCFTLCYWVSEDSARVMQAWIEGWLRDV